MSQLPAKILNADRIVTLVGASPTIFTAYANSYRTVFDEVTFLNDAPGAYVRRWKANGEAVQSFGSWLGNRGNALTWWPDAAEPEMKVEQIARQNRIPALSSDEYVAWRSAQEARVYPGDLYVVSDEDDGEDIAGASRPVPSPREGRLVYRSAAGRFDVRRTPAPYSPGRHSDTGYSLYRGETSIVSLVRPIHGDSDTCGELALAIHTALSAAPEAEPVDSLLFPA